MKLEDLKGRCRIEGGCWIWAGSVTKQGIPRVWAPDFTLHGGEKRAQTGRRAMWHVKTKKPIPEGWRVFGTCGEAACINPAHAICEPVADRGKRVAEAGDLKGSVRRIMANRAIGRLRSGMTPDLVNEINRSPESGQALARRLSISPQVVSKVRTGKLLCLQPVGGLFTGLMRNG